MTTRTDALPEDQITVMRTGPKEDSSVSTETPTPEPRWVCQCGYNVAEDDPHSFNRHITIYRNKGLKDQHQSQGLVVMETGEFVRKFTPALLRSKKPETVPIVPLPDGADPSMTPPEIEVSKKAKGQDGDKPTVRVTYRPKVYDLDESLLNLFHVFQGSARVLGIEYAGTFGEWIRDTVFRFYIEHKEIMNLSGIFTEDEKRQILEGSNAETR